MSTSISETTFNLNKLQELLSRETQLRTELYNLYSEVDQMLQSNSDDADGTEDIDKNELQEQFLEKSIPIMQALSFVEETINTYIEQHADAILTENVLDKLGFKPFVNIRKYDSYREMLEECRRLNRKDLMEIIDCLIGSDPSKAKQAFSELQKKCSSKKDHLACRLISDCYWDGLGTGVDKKMAFELNTQLANDNSPLALTFLAEQYLFGTQFVEQDIKKAQELFEKACGQKEYYFPNIRYASILLDSNLEQNRSKALEMLKSCAEKESSCANALLACKYYDLEKNPELVFFHASRSSDDYYGAIMIGLCYLSGMGVEENKEKAIEIFKHSASLGCPEASVVLGEIYENGIEELLMPDLLLAFQYHFELLKSCEFEAINDKFLPFITRNQHEPLVMYEATRMINHCMRQHSLKNPIASFILGTFHQLGIIFPENLDTAITYYKRAHDLGCPHASYQLGMLCQSSKQTTLSPNEAKFYFKMAEPEVGDFEEAIKDHIFSNSVILLQSQKEITLFFTEHRKRQENSFGLGLTQEPKDSDDKEVSKIGQIISEYAYF